MRDGRCVGACPPYGFTCKSVQECFGVDVGQTNFAGPKDIGSKLFAGGRGRRPVVSVMLGRTGTIAYTSFHLGND